MTEELMVGTVGWDYDHWVASYYSDDLPDDWRFAYYSNEHRSVLVPSGHIKPNGADVVSDWVEDCDEEFRFVVEIPKNSVLDADESRLQSFMKGMESLRSHLAGYYVSLGAITGQELAQLQSRFSLLQQHAPLCIDYDRDAKTSNQLCKIANDVNVGLRWHPDIEKVPVAGGALMLLLGDAKEPREQRRLIECLEKWMQDSDGLAGLFLQTPATASQARIIAEMLGV